MNPRNPRSYARRAVLLFALIAPALGAARDVTVAIVDDGAGAREVISMDVLSAEIDDLMGAEFQVTIAPAESGDGDWSMSGARSALDDQLANRNVDAIITTGLLGSAAAADKATLAKPVIALMVGDIELQNYPHSEGRSGKRNFTYLYDYGGVSDELEDFAQLARFDHVAALVDADWLTAVPAFESNLAEISRQIGARVTIVPVTDSATAALDAIPADAQAVYVTPLMRFDWSDLETLSSGLIARQLPSFSSIGRAEVEQGLLGTTSGSTVDEVILARRIAILLQRILLGSDAGTLNVGFETHGRLLINMETARAIGFSPTWATLVDAELLHRDAEAQAAPVSLVDAMEIALEANLDLRVAAYDVEISRDDVKLARSPLLPQLNLEATSVHVDEDRAVAGLAVERTSDAQLVGTQLIYSEQAHAGYRIAQLVANAVDDNLRVATLDTLAGASSSYLNVLRAKALEDVTRSNVEVTRTNLDLARVRARVGHSGRAEVLRWESEIARGRQNLAVAEAAREQAETELKRVLSRPLAEHLPTSEQGLSDVIALLESPGFQKYVDNPLNWSVFQNYYSELALKNSPEVSAFDSLVHAQERQVKADRRTFYVPNIALQARGGRNLNRGGIGSSALDSVLGDNEWSVGVQLTLPLFNGGALRAQLNRSRHRLEQFEVERDVVMENVEARVRSALQRIGGSYPAIELSQQAADAAGRNLDLVTDQYSRGAVTVTDLIDAQEARLQSDLAAADARYVFLIDFVEVQRAAGDFELLLRPGRTADWMNGLETYYREHK